MKSPTFTCILCKITFQSSDIQRVHYRSEWHLYNLKRKIAGFPSVSAHCFSQKMVSETWNEKKEEKERVNGKKKKKKENGFNDKNDFNEKKGFNEENDSYILNKSKEAIEEDKKLYMNGLELKKSEENMIDVYNLSYLDSILNEKKELSESEEEKLIKEHIAKRIKLKITDCLFCTFKFSTLNENVEHMKKSHSLFIPEQEYLIDLEGLIEYLGEKISIGNVCLSCKKVGKSLESIRQHMFSKGHYSIAYDTEEERLELSDYYDYSSYSLKDNDADWEDISSDQDNDDILSIYSDNDNDVIIENDYELILPSKIRLGHRSLIRYYQQTLRSRNFQRQSGDRNPSGLVRQEYVQRSLQGIDQSKRKFSQKHIRTYQDVFQKENYKTAIGLKSNHQKYFRNELLQ
ncbi:hypothetical protein T552_00502 [Pneumocystis carinii B80]|uniref:C2H2-type domain-containing protein n=1 Tax=Pneumocystis carinii (strain B80) TaxID=1408658 RepID=A0A0W4ZQY6_PNEC8|nr:hypothetical protein T552_00502 [Pneumocystis carinii B80]KTW30790.1 hypothetical protein T552_00502 [Pneumocystis carinii B80]